MIVIREVMIMIPQTVESDLNPMRTRVSVVRCRRLRRENGRKEFEPGIVSGRYGRNFSNVLPLNL